MKKINSSSSNQHIYKRKRDINNMYKVVIDKCNCDGRYTHQEILYYNSKERAYERANEESKDTYTTLFVKVEELQTED